MLKSGSSTTKITMMWFKTGWAQGCLNCGSNPLSTHCYWSFSLLFFLHKEARQFSKDFKINTCPCSLRSALFQLLKELLSRIRVEALCAHTCLEHLLCCWLLTLSSCEPSTCWITEIQCSFLPVAPYRHKSTFHNTMHNHYTHLK